MVLNGHGTGATQGLRYWGWGSELGLVSGWSRDCSQCPQGWCRASRTTSRSPRPWRVAAWPTSLSGRAGAPSGRAGHGPRPRTSTTAVSQMSCVRPALLQVSEETESSGTGTGQGSGPEGSTASPHEHCLDRENNGVGWAVCSLGPGWAAQLTPRLSGASPPGTAAPCPL